MLLLHAIAHLLVDALCAATLFGPVKSAAQDAGLLILLYNTLAFSTQCLVGLAADRMKKHAPSASVSMLAVVLGFALPLPPLLRVMLVGLGNSVFHVAGGAYTLEKSGGRAGRLGVFVAPGAIGLTLGTLWPSLGVLFAVLLTLCAVLEIPLSRMRSGADSAGENAAIPEPRAGHGRVFVSVLLLIAAVATRAVGGAVVSFPWKTGAAAVLILTAAVWAGKTAGGFLCDRIGPARSALASAPAAALCIAFCSMWMLPSLAGQFALNLTMPVTLWLLYRAMPEDPGLAFGLAASALWPGTIVGRLITLTGPAAKVLTVLTFLFGLIAILYSARVILPRDECPAKEGFR